MQWESKREKGAERNRSGYRSIARSLPSPQHFPGDSSFGFLFEIAGVLFKARQEGFVFKAEGFLLKKGLHLKRRGASISRRKASCFKAGFLLEEEIWRLYRCCGSGPWRGRR